MKNVRKRIAAALMTCAIVGSLGVMPVLAGTIGEDGTYVGNDTSVTIGKDLVIYNDGYTQCYSPAITYTYRIAPATVTNQSVTDNTGKVMQVYAGDADAVIGYNATDGYAETNVVFNSTLVQEATETDCIAEAIRGEMTFAFNMDNFSSPGIYRYVITDVTPASALVAAGIVRPSDYEDTKYLDVYVVEKINQTPGTPPYEIAGYTLFDTNTSITEHTEKDVGFRTAITTITNITVPGRIIPGTEGGTGVATEAGTSGLEGDNSFDYYYSYNLDLTKIIDGNMADKSHDFPFSIEVATPDGTTVPTTVFAGDTLAQLSANTSGSMSAGLSNGETYYVCGVNPFATITVSEQNDTGSTYIATISDGSTVDQSTGEDGVIVAPSGSVSAEALVVSNYSSAATAVPSSISGNANLDLVFTNTLEAGPPTGLMMVAAPFVAVASVIGGLFAVNKIKTKKAKEE